jgi:hypothetical protein
MLARPTCALGGIGILVLYTYAMSQYGVFHLLDYPIFLGFAAYLVLTSRGSERAISLRMPVLYTSVCVSLMWASVEKWAYPHWTYPVLDAGPHLTMAIPPETYMVVTGLVEFAFAFYILTGLALLRLALFTLALVFVAA